MRSDLSRPHVRPSLAAVARLVNAVADRNAVARPRFAGPNPDILGVLRIDRDGADRLHRLFVKHRAVTGPAVVRFPNAAAGRPDVESDFARRLVRACDGGDASAHGG